MKIMGIDPGGKTTGICVAVDKPKSDPAPIYSNEYSLEDSYHGIRSAVTVHRPDVIIIEDVVKTGQMNTDKFNQVRAFERAFIAGSTAPAGKKIQINTISPQHTRACKVEVPKEVKGRHARDAYRVATAWSYKRWQH